jgi:hypothetical protein
MNLTFKINLTLNLTTSLPLIIAMMRAFALI